MGASCFAFCDAGPGSILLRFPPSPRLRRTRRLRRTEPLLRRYEADFRENAIDADILRDLTDQDLEKLGVVLGDRRRLLRAIAVLDDAPSPAKLASGPLPVTFAPASGAVTPPISAAIEVSGEGL
jgi:hypothetical protein